MGKENVNRRKLYVYGDEKGLREKQETYGD